VDLWARGNMYCFIFHIFAELPENRLAIPETGLSFLRQDLVCHDIVVSLLVCLMKGSWRFSSLSSFIVT